MYTIIIAIAIACSSGNKNNNNNNRNDNNKNAFRISFEGLTYDIPNKYKSILELDRIDSKLEKNKHGENVFHTLRDYVNGSFNIDKDKDRDQEAADLVEELASKLSKDKLDVFLKEKSGTDSKGDIPLENVTENDKAKPGMEKYYNALKKYTLVIDKSDLDKYEYLLDKNKSKGSYIYDKDGSFKGRPLNQNEKLKFDKSSFKTELNLKSEDYSFLENSTDGSCQFRQKTLKLLFLGKEKNLYDEIIQDLEKLSNKLISLDPKFKNESKYKEAIEILKALQNRSYKEIIIAMNDHNFNNIFIESFMRSLYASCYIDFYINKFAKFGSFIDFYSNIESETKLKLDEHITKEDIEKLKSFSITFEEKNKDLIKNMENFIESTILRKIKNYILNVLILDMEKDKADEFIVKINSEDISYALDGFLRYISTISNLSDKVKNLKKLCKIIENYIGFKAFFLENIFSLTNKIRSNKSYGYELPGLPFDIFLSQYISNYYLEYDGVLQSREEGLHTNILIKKSLLMN